MLNPNFAESEFEVTTLQIEGLSVSVKESQQIPGVGKTVSITVLGAEQLVRIDIVSPQGKIIEELSFPASDQGNVIQPWIIPPGIEPGTYTFKARDAFNSAETTFEVK